MYSGPLFIAVDVPDAVRSALEQSVVEELRASLQGARWTRPDGRHFTLKFLGEVADGDIGAICDAVAGAARVHETFEASLSGLGAFPNPRRPRVLWVGLGTGAESMARLAAEIDRGLAPLGFPPEKRPFRGHLTLARFPRPRVQEALPAVAVPAEPFAVRGVVVFRSEQHTGGAKYTAIGRFPLSTE